MRSARRARARGAREAAVEDTTEERKQYVQMLESTAGVTAELTWEDAMRLIINNPTYRVLKTLAERKETFQGWKDAQFEVVEEARRQAQRQRKEDFLSMLKECAELTSRTRFQRVVTLFSADPRWVGLDELDREHQLKGAAERARIEAELSGGFKGLTSKVEALNIGRAAQDFHAKWFTMFANIPKDERGKVTAPQLASAIERNHFLRARLVENAKIDASKFDDSKDGNAFVDLAEALLAVIDTNANGEIEPHELERVIRGWEKVDYTPTQTWETDRAHQLAGAAERARIRAEMAGGFTGLSREEALRIGESAQDFHEKWFTMFANIDVDKDGSIDRAELTKALEKNDFLSRTICKNLRFSPMESRRSKAKELVEGAPNEIKADVPKEEAESLKEKLEGVGGTVTLE